MIAPLTADQTLDLAAQARHVVATTQSLIAINRRRSHRWLGISGESDDNRGGAFFPSVRRRLERGFLMPAPSHVLAGNGTEKTCAICAQKIYPGEIEYETSVADGDVEISLWTHVGCFRVWRWASQVLEAERRSAGAQRPSE